MNSYTFEQHHAPATNPKGWNKTHRIYSYHSLPSFMNPSPNYLAHNVSTPCTPIYTNHAREKRSLKTPLPFLPHPPQAQENAQKLRRIQATKSGLLLIVENVPKCCYPSLLLHIHKCRLIHHTQEFPLCIPARRDPCTSHAHEAIGRETTPQRICIQRACPEVRKAPVCCLVPKEPGKSAVPHAGYRTPQTPS